MPQDNFNPRNDPNFIRLTLEDLAEIKRNPGGLKAAELRAWDAKHLPSDAPLHLTRALIEAAEHADKKKVARAS